MNNGEMRLDSKNFPYPGNIFSSHEKITRLTHNLYTVIFVNLQCQHFCREVIGRGVAYYEHNFGHYEYLRYVFAIIVCYYDVRFVLI